MLNFVNMRNHAMHASAAMIRNCSNQPLSLLLSYSSCAVDSRQSFKWQMASCGDSFDPSVAIRSIKFSRSSGSESNLGAVVTAHAHQEIRNFVTYLLSTESRIERCFCVRFGVQALPDLVVALSRL